MGVKKQTKKQIRNQKRKRTPKIKKMEKNTQSFIDRISRIEYVDYYGLHYPWGRKFLVLKDGTRIIM